VRSSDAAPLMIFEFQPELEKLGHPPLAHFAILTEMLEMLESVIY
jgi:hypothetical protein